MADDDPLHSEILTARDATEVIALVVGTIDDEPTSIEVVKEADGTYTVTIKGLPDS